MKAILFIFNLILEMLFYVCYPIIALVLYFKNYAEAIHPCSLDTHKGILFHASSMGEVNAIRPLVMKIIKQHPSIRVCITTTSLTGLMQARSISSKIQANLSVLDVPHLRYKQLRQINPGLVCIVETEIWLNMLFWCSINQVPVLLLNARMSERSLHRYKLIKSLLNSVGASIMEIHAQSNPDAQRFGSLFNKQVFDSGNLKFCLELKEHDIQVVRHRFGMTPDDFVICWGSSRPGEEALLMSIYPQLSVAIPNLRLIIAIRHPERLSEALACLGSEPYSLYSKIEESVNTNNRVLVIDMLGVLDMAYAVCDVAIVGGSFHNFGGHNPLEPAFYKKATIIGIYHASCKDSVQHLLQGQGIIVSEAKRLQHDILSLYNDPAGRMLLGKNAKKVLYENREAIETQYSAIKRFIP